MEQRIKIINKVVQIIAKSKMKLDYMYYISNPMFCCETTAVMNPYPASVTFSNKFLFGSCRNGWFVVYQNSLLSAEKVTQHLQ